MPDRPPPDPADHAEDFARRYPQEMDYQTGDRMTELGIPSGKIGSRTPGKGHATFISDERSGGNDPAGGLTVYSDVSSAEFDLEPIRSRFAGIDFARFFNDPDRPLGPRSQV